MRRKSTRNSQKATPDKSTKEPETTPKTRRGRRRKRTPSKSSDSDDEPLVAPKVQAVVEQAPDTTSKSHTPSDEEQAQEAVWKVTSSDDASKGEIQKLKICLRRPVSESPEKSKPRRRNKSSSYTDDDAAVLVTAASEDKISRRSRSRGSPIVRNECSLSSQEQDDDDDENKGKGKSKGKHKSKIEKSPTTISESETQSNSEISENVQVTPQSPSIDKPVDNENDSSTVVADDVKQIINENEKHEETNTNTDGDETLMSNKIQNIEIATIVSNEAEDETETTVAVNSTEDTVSSPPPISPPLQEHIEPEQINIQQESKDVDRQESCTPPPPPVKTVEAIPLEEASKLDDNLDKSEESKIDEENKTTEPSHLDDGSKTPEGAPKEEEKKKPLVRRKLRRNADYLKQLSEPNESENNDHISAPKIKPKWEISESITSSLIKIDLDSIRDVCPTIDFPEEPDLHLNVEKERRQSMGESSGLIRLDRKVSIDSKPDLERPPYEKQSSVGSTTQDSEDNANIIAFNRKISIVDDTASKLKPPPSPAKNPISDVLFITNLVRPFTLKQLKELLERTGHIQEEGFWTDRIKSKCYVHYETQEEAESTRNALHGVQWPIGNGKQLVIDYATVEDLEKAKNPPVAPVPAAAAPPPPLEQKVAVKENLDPVETNPRNDNKQQKIPEKKRSENVREWDIGKKDSRRNRSRSRERSRKHKRLSTSPEDFIARKHRKAEESLPQKLMDDLFLKTKASPSIYWQPLSPEEILMKQQQRLIRMEEHKRRMEENSRIKGREMGRGAFRRRYD